MKTNWLSWVLRFMAAIIMLQTLYFKFSGAEESIFIFSSLGIEPWGRIATGVFELIASILLLIPSTVVFGALLTIGVMAGAIFSHLFKLGIIVQNDSGQLFVYACVVMICAIILLFIHKTEIIKLFNKLKIKQYA